MSIHKKPLVLAILDGWGYRAETQANAIALARKPTYDKLLAEFPNTLLHASDHFVGLPDGQMGNISTSARAASSTWTSPVSTR
jgi:2,3-bisphosphoglycerate-independent phosphoglycerate mutase